MPELVLEPEEARRRQRRRQKALSLQVALIVPPASYFPCQLGSRAAREVEEMGPWPPPTAEPAAIFPPDLSALGLGAPQIVEARGSNSLWTEGTYVDGAVAEYRLNGQAALWIAALRYDSSRAATNQFEGYIAWAEENCDRYTYGTLGASGRIECKASDDYNKTLHRRIWIVDVVATDAAPMPPRQLVDDARDAMAQHWKTLH
jgi:hypothetical protein